MDTPYQVGRDIHVLPSNLPLPGVGVLPVNAYVLRAAQPVLIDTGIGFDGDQFLRPWPAGCWAGRRRTRRGPT